MVVFNIIIYIEAASNEIVFWFTIVTTGIGAILGFHQQSLLLKHFFTVLFLLSAGGVLAGSLILKSYTYSFIVMLVVVIFGVGVYFAKRK
ncbi:hypothetical protein M3181_25245 [Mesobacillus maritimus]|uniref:hypothetical protein n=1 Tax=Mesobacillus maritimus TaxID=1643336 RepID=UPI0020413468|nr:hypothetical protein [Mesobacillus maritimus]MCM3672168.1 hypothetical protein [Mesobacillus maritimus]